MIEVRLFAGLRTGRGKVFELENGTVSTVLDVMDHFSIRREEVNILLVNGFHQKPEYELRMGTWSPSSPQ